MGVKTEKKTEKVWKKYFCHILNFESF